MAERSNAVVRKAVIPAAGRGTRFLPASKAIPKELIPVIDRPAIQYVVEEAVAGGLSEIALITAVGKEAVAAHFAPDPALEATLTGNGDEQRLAAVQRITALGPLSYIVQDEPKGLGHAVGVAEDFVGGEPFAVLLGDDFCDERDPILPTMIALHQLTGRSVVALMDFPPELIRIYGSIEPSFLALADIPGASSDPRIPADAEVCEVARLNEKPSPGEEYSSLAVIGRYVFTPAIFDAIRHTRPGRGGEIQLTDAIDHLARVPDADGGGVLGLVFRGRRYDTGDKMEYVKATVRLALGRPDLAPEFGAWLRGYLASEEEA